jgi:putative esterase
MGGFGAFSYAARHPDLFVAAASFSGVLALEAFSPLPLGTAAERWHVRAHDPVNLAKNLRGLRLFMSSGNGERSPSDAAANGANAAVDSLEANTHACLLRMEAALHAARVPVAVDDYGPGVHDWPYWQRELHRFMPLLLATFAAPPAPPVPWSYRTAEAATGVWGYSLTITRPGGVYGFTDFANVQPEGFSLAGSGAVSVVTAPIYVAGHSYATRRDTGQATPVVADARGSLRLTISLGSKAVTARITISAMPR